VEHAWPPLWAKPYRQVAAALLRDGNGGAQGSDNRLRQGGLRRRGPSHPGRDKVQVQLSTRRFYKLRLVDFAWINRWKSKLSKRIEELFRYYKEKKVRYLRLISLLLSQKLVTIKHDSILTILAFSDYKIHEFKPLIEHIKRSRRKPDIIIYAGDAIDRFVPVPIDRLDLPSPCEGARTNIFEELARYSKYGLAAVRGNNDIVRAWIWGRNVYDLHTSLLKIGPFLIVGLEGSTRGSGLLVDDLESDVKLRLEFAQTKLGNKGKMIIVSHSPPRGILDRALRYGDEAIGSIAIRDFLDKEDRVCLVICGHVHRCGGQYERFNGATIVNVSSHDDPYSRANIAWITIEPEGNVLIDMIKLPSLLEQIITENGPDVTSKLTEKCRLSRQEAQLFIKSAKKYGQKLFSDLEGLATIKFTYGLPWKLVFLLYEQGITSASQLTEEAFLKISEEVSGLDRVHWNRAYVKFKREKAIDEVRLLHAIPLTAKNKIVIFDAEYNREMGVLYGFLDLDNGEVKQFWFDEKNKAADYVASRKKENSVFVHWGGKDRSLLEGDLNQYPQTFNLLYFCQTSLVAPITSTTLKDVYDCLCGHAEDKWWETFFYKMNGWVKLMLCNRVLMDPSDVSARKSLMEVNKADIIALKRILAELLKLPKPNIARPVAFTSHVSGEPC